MRKVFWCGTLLAVAVTAAVYWTGVYAGRHPETLLGQCTGIIYEGRSCPRSCPGDVPGCEDSDLCSPEEPQAVVEQLPDQPEPIDLFKSSSEPVQEPSPTVSALPALEGSLPSLADANEDCYKTMPSCEDDESEQQIMPYAGDDNISGLQLSFPPFKLFGFIDIAGLTPKRLTGVRATVDTMEFRPTDAKKGEFEKPHF